ncbi:MAG: DUF4405 domain-containing protein [Pseudomonadota bacterium]
MKIHSHRPWITPLVMGAFLLSAVTGVLMFFHLDTGLNKVAHEWLSWAMVVGVALHVVLNLPAFKRYLGQKTALAVMGLFGLVLALSFVSLPGSKTAPPYVAPLQALARAPLPVLAQVLGQSPEALQANLEKAGLPVDNPQQSLRDLVGPDLKAQVRTLNRLLPKP